MQREHAVQSSLRPPCSCTLSARASFLLGRAPFGAPRASAAGRARLQRRVAQHLLHALLADGVRMQHVLQHHVQHLRLLACARPQRPHGTPRACNLLGTSACLFRPGAKAGVGASAGLTAMHDFALSFVNACPFRCGKKAATCEIRYKVCIESGHSTPKANRSSTTDLFHLPPSRLQCATRVGRGCHVGVAPACRRTPAASYMTTRLKHSATANSALPRPNWNATAVVTACRQTCCVTTELQPDKVSPVQVCRPITQELGASQPSTCKRC